VDDENHFYLCILETSQAGTRAVTNDPHLKHSRCCSICNILLDKSVIYTRNIKADKDFFIIFFVSCNKMKNGNDYNRKELSLMGKGRMIALAGIAVGVVAIGMLFSNNEGEQPKAKDEAARAKSQVERGMIAGALEPSLTYEKKDGNYVVTFKVRNQTERVQTVTFTSGKKYDYILYRNGKKVKQFSEGKLFTQIYEQHQLKQGEELVFQETFTNLPKGNYKLEWWLADKNWPNAKAAITFTVE
jgi:hypothetical protein